MAESDPTSVHGLVLGELGYGAANLGNLYRELSDAEALDVLHAAWESGVRYFDTAPHYGLGLSERRLGAFLRTKPRNEYVISTKVGRLLRPNPDWHGELDLDNDFHVLSETMRVWDPTPAGIRSSLNESLGRLGLERVDILYLHDPEYYDLTAGLELAIPALAQLKSEGLVGAIGVGSMETHALLASARTGLIDVLMVAGRYTLADAPVVGAVTEACVDNGVAIVAAAVFNSGLLATDDLSEARYDYGDVPADILARVRAIGRICAEFSVSLPSAALRYPLRDPLVRNVVVGSSKPDQIESNARRMHDAIPDGFWTRLVEDGLIPN